MWCRLSIVVLDQVLDEFCQSLIMGLCCLSFYRRPVGSPEASIDLLNASRRELSEKYRVYGAAGKPRAARVCVVRPRPLLAVVSKSILPP